MKTRNAEVKPLSAAETSLSEHLAAKRHTITFQAQYLTANGWRRLVKEHADIDDAQDALGQFNRNWLETHSRLPETRIVRIESIHTVVVGG